MIYGFGGCCVFAVVGYAFKPDTRYVQLLTHIRGRFWKRRKSAFAIQEVPCHGTYIRLKKAMVKSQEVKLTRHSIQTWALEEARRRLEAEGILEDPEAKK